MESLLCVFDALRGGQPIHVLDSYWIRRGRCVGCSGTDAAGKYYLTPMDEDALEVLSKVYREHQLLTRLGQAGPVACYFFTGEARVRISTDQLEEHLNSECLPGDLDLVQVPKPSACPVEYSLTAVLKGSDYRFSLFETLSKKEIKSSARVQAASQVAKAALNSLGTPQQVATVELTTDEHQRFWLSHISQCLSPRLLDSSRKTPKTPKTPRSKGLSSSHKARVGTSLRKELSGSKLQGTSRTKKVKRAKPGPALSCNRTITSATLSLLRIPTGKASKS